MQVGVGEHRRDHRSLPRSPVAGAYEPLFEYTRLQPFLDQTDDAFIADAVFQETDQPLLIDRVERPFDRLPTTWTIILNK